MDFLDEAQNHAQIRETLGAAISEQTTIDPKLFKSDRLCATGCWLHGEGARRWAGNHAFLSLLEAHREFHLRAGDVADLVNRRQFSDAQRAMRSGTPFAHALNDLSAALRRMKAASSVIAA